jgi:hypothetical protein
MPIWPTSTRDNELKFFVEILPIGSNCFLHLNPTADVIFIFYLYFGGKIRNRPKNLTMTR